MKILTNRLTVEQELELRRRLEERAREREKTVSSLPLPRYNPVGTAVRGQHNPVAANTGATWYKGSGCCGGSRPHYPKAK